MGREMGKEWEGVEGRRGNARKRRNGKGERRKGDWRREEEEEEEVEERCLQ